MTHAQKESIFRISILVLIQWVSLAIVILNTAALYILQSADDRHLRLADYIYLVLGAISFIASTVILVFHLHVYYRVTDIFLPPRHLSISESLFGLISIILWVLVTVLMITHLQGLSTSCQFSKSLMIASHNDVCELFDTMTILAFVNLGGWILDLLATFFILVRSPMVPTTIFTIEAPPQRFSHPLITPLDSILFEKQENSLDIAPDVVVTAPSTNSTNSVNPGSIEKNAYTDQRLLHPDSYYTYTVETIELELPDIQQGMSQIDVSFI
ncbi:hypothetical protein K501DRAFT_275577 [Backusella circina FSU 941]|nr:hypothetical protein K501DRAFT_280566 [Backusella circina FSU 941]KAI8880415.1 hypothetical protein K501DRAFT_275577 [Backusella circina FSU 941]